MFRGVGVRAGGPFATCLTHCFLFYTLRVWRSSLILMGGVGSMRDWFIQEASLERLRVVRSTEKLVVGGHID